MEDRLKNARLIAIFLLGWVLFNYPILSLFNLHLTVFGIPVLYLYIFGIWCLIILLLVLLTQIPSGTLSNGGETSGSPV